jgi:hypothetical protein
MHVLHYVLIGECVTPGVDTDILESDELLNYYLLSGEPSIITLYSAGLIAYTTNKTH